MEGAETQTCLWGASLQTRVLKTQRKRQRGKRVNAWSFFFLSSQVDGCCCVCLLCFFHSTSLFGCTSPVLPCPGVLLQMDCFCLSLSSSVFSLFLHHLFPFCSSLMLPTFSSIFFPVLCPHSVSLLICLCIHKHSSFCPVSIVYRALISIKWASLLLQ